MEQGKGTNPMIVAVVAALVMGLAGGYYYGFTRGKATVVAEQDKAAQVAAEEAQQQLAEQANPFGSEEESAVNPFTETYENPFEGGGFNPFAQ
ncbi:MAG: hypothetical protein G01um101448_683 [Parcubacteria group bacterium Gr01-1014_48]|nr:MAG: hypothetical protein Greene041614_436 [Parcubacteria group bacterium Greene0416_14]TSC73597.1 MAG: hypothetical protein G01um101448_683 [Parcubacteria group bacterium Gr01-1014_48]TSD00970.1 MAG: hypothetical protein Greene101415_543 [Parcubacteria group bacterium Greene1014_15]TSD07540.1 MAG: hypothetical protein Greene07144_856 [Parcubacteria group bacterium Greene0714_4]